MPLPENLVVDILDGDVTVHWKHPVNVTANFQYNVQMAKYVKLQNIFVLSPFSPDRKV